MTMHRSHRLLPILASVAFIASACGSSTPSSAPSAAAATGAPATEGPVATPSATFGLPSFSPAAMRWYCCLGTRQDPTHVPTENEVAAALGTAFPGSSLKFEVVTYDSARDTLATQIRGDNSPDIVGPVGIGGFAAFQGQWLDLAPYIEKSHLDLSQFAS